MSTLPNRPNLDHLRRQAKALLSALAEGDPKAAAAMSEHLPAARGKGPEALRAMGLRLADAQSAIARQSGFSNWPQLTRHVETLRALEGTWGFVSLEVEGSGVPPAAIASSKLLIDGDRFRTESAEGVYEGVFNIDVETTPHAIDIEFVEGPEAGNWNYGIFRLGGDTLEICLDMKGKPRPTAFRTSVGSGCAYEVLRRASGARPAEVDGGVRTAIKERSAAAAPGGVTAGFEFVASSTLTRLQGEWRAERTVRDGKELPAFMLKTGIRVAKGNHVTVSFGGSVVVDALVRIDESTTPMHVDYANRGGPAKGTVQHGIMEWRGETAWFCMAAPGHERPRGFECPVGSGRTVSAWTKAGREQS